MSADVVRHRTNSLNPGRTAGEMDTRLTIPARTATKAYWDRTQKITELLEIEK